jgi:hypothetical protein
MIKLKEFELLEIAHKSIEAWTGRGTPFDVMEVERLLWAFYKLQDRIIEKNKESEEELSRRLWSCNAALIRAGVEPYKYPSFAEAIDELAKRAKKEEGIRTAARELVEWLQQTIIYQSPEVSRLIRNLSEAFSEGEGSEDRLYKTARTLVDFYYQAGPDEFRSRFGSLDILDPAVKIIKEGEGNPHPWPGLDS